jgi:pullulanase/glycogen debranching enzyme
MRGVITNLTEVLERTISTERPEVHDATGQSSPLGATVYPDGINFSVFSRSASRIELLLFDVETTGFRA